MQTKVLRMKGQVIRLASMCLVLVMIFTTGCKKEEIDKDNPDGPNEEEPEWIRFHTANSTLPDNQVNALAIDLNDVKWVGTANGLVRISGEEWTVFNTSNSPLPSSFIQSLVVTQNGTAWIGTNKGLVRYDQTGWIVYDTANSVLPDNAIMCLAHDNKQNIIWVGTAKGLIKIDENKNWQLYDALEDDLILSMAVDQNGALWLGMFNHFAFRGSIRQFAGEQWSTFHLDQMGYPSTFPYALTVDQNNMVVAVLTGTSVKSVIRHSNNGWQEVPGPVEATGLKTILLEKDEIWVGGNALYLFGNSTSLFLTIPGVSSGILSMALDSKGRKWLGTTNGGLAGYKSTSQ
ncbi:ligand-binding sensor domain-containing protein [Adhaeribacter radiodurans]|uniref:Uncharacterized protein n=1 Tax=Adhaeribacter radiodurans TaxID=2745197 RepID=A0A7L7LD53_9BACT|nr:two-component regulator propeller domain-containing protein [Adhaeribacter radiodurans]QMU30624.1 hypothetical protein HUW48_22500 [Adhaeribacter radiodurans]